jgi:hypothetical protein
MNLIRQTKIMTGCEKWQLFNKVSNAYAKYYSPIEYLAVDEIDMLSFQDLLQGFEMWDKNSTWTIFLLQIYLTIYIQRPQIVVVLSD